MVEDANTPDFRLYLGSSHKLNLTEIDLYATDSTAKYFLQAASRSTLTRIRLQPEHCQTSCLLGLEFEGVKAFQFSAIMHIHYPTRSTLTILDSSELLNPFPNLTHLIISTEADELNRPYFRIKLADLLTMLPASLEYLDLRVPSCAYNQNVRIIDNFWLQEDRPNLDYWATWKNEFDRNQGHIEINSLLKGKFYLIPMLWISTISPIVNYPRS